MKTDILVEFHPTASEFESWISPHPLLILMIPSIVPSADSYGRVLPFQLVQIYPGSPSRMPDKESVDWIFGTPTPPPGFSTLASLENAYSCRATTTLLPGAHWNHGRHVSHE